jgi:hypothetical protein
VDREEGQSEKGATEDAEIDARRVSEVLDGIPGGHERAKLGLHQALAQDTVRLDEL